MARITLTYQFDVEDEVLDRNQPWNALEPQTHQGITTIDYDYEVIIDEWVIVDYLIDHIGEYTFKGFSLDKQNGFELAIKTAFFKDMFDCESLAEDSDFYEYCKKRYEDDARNQCSDYYKIR